MEEWRGLTENAENAHRGPARHLEVISAFLSRLGWLNPYLWTGRSHGWEIILQLNSRPLPDDLCGPGAYECSARWVIIILIQVFITKWHLTEMANPRREPNLNLEGFIALSKAQKCDLSSGSIAFKIVCGSQADHGVFSRISSSESLHPVWEPRDALDWRSLPGAVQHSTVISCH